MTFHLSTGVSTSFSTSEVVDFVCFTPVPPHSARVYTREQKNRHNTNAPSKTHSRAYTRAKTGGTGVILVNSKGFEVENEVEKSVERKHRWKT
jgi:hypothetical protein